MIARRNNEQSDGLRCGTREPNDVTVSRLGGHLFRH